MNRVFSILIIIQVAITGLSAQERWEIDDCISYALENNLKIGAQSITNETNREYLAQNRRDLLPYINGGGNYGINFGKSVDPNTNAVTYNNFASNNYSLQGGITLFQGFVRSNRIAWSKFNYLAGIEAQKALEIDIAFEVMEAYYNTLYYGGLLEIVVEQKRVSEKTLEKATKESEIGVGAKTDVLEIEARLAEEELQVIRTENNLKSSLIQLKKAMNYPINEELLLSGASLLEPVVSGVLEEADTIYALALLHLPEVMAKELELKATEKSLAMVKGSLYPSLSLSGGYYTGFYETNTDGQGNIIAFNEQLKNNASRSLGLSLSVPLFNRWGNRSDIKISKLDLEKKRVELTDYKNSLYYEIETYCQELSAITAEYLQAEKQVEANLLSFEVAEKKREQGLFNVIEYYTGKNQLSNAQSELLRTRLQYLLKRKTIDLYMGNPLIGITTPTEE